MTENSISHVEAPLWEKLAQAKRSRREAGIPEEWRLPKGLVKDEQRNVMKVAEESGILTDEELQITEKNAEYLVQKLLSRQYSSYNVTMAFCKRAIIAHQLTSCLTEIFYQQALEAASALDTEYAAFGVPRGPLHGLPVSLKDCFKVQGVDAAIGYTTFVDQPTPEGHESEITKIMRQSGAILFCKTSVPTALMAGETFSNLNGYSPNPYNRDLSSGGSSGGESALLALRGSPLGIGTDVGGSVRIPASFCGLYSLKPSSGRFPTFGLRDGLEGQEAVRNTVGPMARSLEAIELWSKAVVDSEPWKTADPDCVPIPWRVQSLPEKLCFGFLVDDGYCKSLPPISNALLNVKTKLEAAGHQVIDFMIPDPFYLDTLKFALYQSAAAEVLGANLERSGEPWPRGYEILKDMLQKNEKGEMKRKPATISELWEAQTLRNEYAKRMIEAWNTTQKKSSTGRVMDALLMPCSPWPASQRHGFIYDNYTSLWNVLDYCATTFPVTQVGGQNLVDQHEPRNDIEAQVWGNYSEQATLDAPVSVQLVGRRLSEEFLLGATRVCVEAIQTEGCLGRVGDSCKAQPRCRDFT